MKLRLKATGEIINNCYINNYNNRIELEIYNSEIKDFVILEYFKSLTDLLNIYEEILL